MRIFLVALGASAAIAAPLTAPSTAAVVRDFRLSRVPSVHSMAEPVGSAKIIRDVFDERERRGARIVNPDAVTGTVCTSPDTAINSHDINVALLAICGGIAGSIEQCGGNPTSTSGTSGTAAISLKVATSGQTIDISKGRWEGCVAAARATCGDSPFKSTCIGGADGNSGNVDFSLEKQ